MTRLPVVDMDTCPSGKRELLQEWLDDRGQVNPPGTLWRMLVVSSAGMRAVGKLGAFVRVATSLDPILQEIGALIASDARGYKFEIDIHSRKLVDLGVDVEAVRRARGGTPTGLGDTADAVAGLAYAMADHGVIADDPIDRVALLIGAEHLVELMTVIGYYLMIGDFARVTQPDRRP